MIDQLKAMLEEQRMRLRQLEKLQYTGLVAAGLAAQVKVLCLSLEKAIAQAEYLETQKSVEAELHARFAQ
ncbi:TPA: hypothetical protein NOE81_004955 [Pseudomonas aeruginosa]|uniref:hypothetical protein n=1 Tax=Pseudomonas aeruginosa TaxID=287 RepID=UPI000E3182A4|nr:hypothetical protein [Pseudomonas aeruginosa]NPY29743.1 hypothetical protein [Pseudomonas aeruginosa]HCI1866917.1 hypothetical protein [Pseudomonas aeruginosa]HEP8403894.1 hypothetical protein [Pseudomonas aeruginosa]HEP8763932.1 hypothetical protein [Pseudomonas aeruginosa]HEP8783873.1 hypothetical protein [Pseudomonas aeruginosa]